MDLSFSKVTWKAYGFPNPWAATSSIGEFDQDERPMAIPFLAVAQEVATSPSGCASLCMAAGAKPKGKETFALIS
jgi:hypothetical protein